MDQAERAQFYEVRHVDEKIIEMLRELDRARWGDRRKMRSDGNHPKRRTVDTKEIFVPIQELRMMREGTVTARVATGPITVTQKAEALFRSFLKDAPCERLACMTLDSGFEMIGISKVTDGDIDEIKFYPAAIFTRVLGDGAKYFILAHNHPRGDPTPSREDMSALEELRVIAKMLDRPMLDFMIIGSEGRYYSHRELNYDLA